MGRTREISISLLSTKFDNIVSTPGFPPALPFDVAVVIVTSASEFPFLLLSMPAVVPAASSEALSSLSEFVALSLSLLRYNLM